MIFPLRIEGELRPTRKLQPEERTQDHTVVLRGRRFQAGRVQLERAGWGCELLGSGEEKAMAAVRKKRYRDVHGRNVLFELRPGRAPGVPGVVIDAAGRARAVRTGLQPVDVR